MSSPSGTVTGAKAMRPMAANEWTALMIDTWFGVRPSRNASAASTRPSRRFT